MANMEETERQQSMLNLMVPRMHRFYSDLREKGEVPTNIEVLAACRLPGEFSDLRKLQAMALVEVRDDVDAKKRHVKAGAPVTAKEDTGDALAKAEHARRVMQLAAIKSASAARRERARAEFIAASKDRIAAKKTKANSKGVRVR